MRFIQKEIEIQLDQLPKIIDGADLLLGSSLFLGASTVAEYLNVPYRYIAFCPQLLPSQFHPMIHVRNYDLPKYFNRLSWWVFKYFDFNLNYKKIINEGRKRFGLKSIFDVLRNLLGPQVIVASDPLLAAVPADAVQASAQIGYLHLDPKETLSPDLEDFINAGLPPIYIGFGSMPCKEPAASNHTIIPQGCQIRPSACCSFTRLGKVCR